MIMLIFACTCRTSSRLLDNFRRSSWQSEDLATAMRAACVLFVFYVAITNVTFASARTFIFSSGL